MGKARELEEAVRSRADFGTEHSLYISIWAFLGTRDRNMTGSREAQGCHSRRSDSQGGSGSHASSS